MKPRSHPTIVPVNDGHLEVTFDDEYRPHVRHVPAYREHRIPTSLQRHVGEDVTPPEVIDVLVRKARRAGVIVFLKAELERLPDMARALIESEHKRLCERR